MYNGCKDSAAPGYARDSTGGRIRLARGQRGLRVTTRAHVHKALAVASEAKLEKDGGEDEDKVSYTAGDWWRGTR